MHVRNVLRSEVSTQNYLEMSLYHFDGAVHVNAMWDEFKSIISYCIENSVPKGIKTVKKSKP